MTGLFTDRYYLNLTLGALFLVGAGISLYFIYSLPDGLRLQDGYQPQFMGIYAVLGATFLVGAFALVRATRYRKEVIVFRDRTAEAAAAEAADAENKSAISLDGVRSSLSQARNAKDKIQAGLTAICKQLEAGQGAFYQSVEEDGKRKLVLKSGYALTIGESTVISYEFGEGLVGQAAAVGRTLYVDDVPDGYIKIISGLGSASPRYLLISPLKQNENVTGIVEIASFSPMTDSHRKFVDEAIQLLASTISTQA